jgi:hypothetical protein
MMPSPIAAPPKTSSPAPGTPENLAEMRDQYHQYIVRMMDLLFESHKENLKLLNQVHANLLKQGKSLSENLHHNGNGYAASHQTSTVDLFKSLMDMSSMMFDSAYQAAEKSANIAKDSMVNHAAKTQGARLPGKR